MGWTTVTTTYEALKWKDQRRLTCRMCTKRFTRSRTFTMTQSPFNKNEDGTVRTRKQIYAALRDQAAEWTPDDLCGKCEDEAEANAR